MALEPGLRATPRLMALGLLALLAGGCAFGLPHEEREATSRWKSPEGTVWVVREYRGGRACGREPYEPPDTARVLGASGVTVIETVVQPQGICRSCDCPAYAARHVALIPASEAEIAERLGFEVGAPHAVGR